MSRDEMDRMVGAIREQAGVLLRSLAATAWAGARPPAALAQLFA